ncbi:MAG: HDIG domain-containing protein [Candidatus Cloacimonetes bacterium]|jgi:putative nucleotidyltransferase with HDIG domain|nr:HDIG domain-containing protein [Candidatus Cloacimonadota bacterium]MDD2210028.1 HDIG domain-containing protein [Candidatus Cloacimonadota bacterium]MDD3282159.1 HDIG domain-containing protein [Candidatus Cloacimonadota bacterium]MDD4231447.1 HDIG domain-containing protein [Candidatus Cloacimonadota bacterium]MDY0299446.1 HDIG domain-containing protein [Candidatus Cloacimonadaceae bacterium]
MNSKYLLTIILTAFVIVGLYHIFAVSRFNYPEYQLKEGQVAETEIIAPFDFPVLKSAQQLSNEQEESIRSLSMPYRISDEPLFDALSTMDIIWAVFFRFPDLERADLQKEFEKAGFPLTVESLKFAMDSNARDRVYDDLRLALTEIYNQGIYENIEADSISLWQTDTETRMSITEFLSVQAAEAKLIEKVPEAEKLILDTNKALVKANVLPDKELFTELSQRKLSQIPDTESIVLQNEVVIRKNARVGKSEIEKLESLQAAYVSRNIQKSAFQQMLLALGLLLYVFVILLVANHYYGIYNKDFREHLADYLPINLGFVLITLFAILGNHVLGLNNLLIPFALTVVAAAILVGIEFGILYSITSMLIVSPFINWETYPPIVFILSSIITIILIKRQKAQHEFLSIWFYLLLSGSVVTVAISIYKSDPINIVFRNIGFGLISSAISIMGIIIIVPYYEKKWNRATKQTLLELLDFNHPLLKKLATSAVGTYHHSLIVGNLAERAAEAIGANPLLARVGSYYHDIGKIINTEIFTENNEDSSEIHDEMSPDKSASLIKNHVLEGITLAKKYKIPQPVIDIIVQHHGDSLIRYFYDRAEKMSLATDTENYRYPGPRPQSKEAALVMIADIVESTTKAKTILNEKDIEKIIDDTISRLIREGQFDEAPITMKDLSKIKQSMLPVLGSIYRKRLDYPEDNDRN